MRYFEDMLARRVAGEPLQYVLGRWGFRTLDLLVDKRALIPRPETEVLVGVALDELPAHHEIEDYRKAVIDKNWQFFHRYKALNQVHIVGERKKSNSGRELPKELAEFDEIVEQRDAALQAGVPKPETRVWRLIANPEMKLP